MTSAARTEVLTGIAAATRERLGAAACSVALLDGAELVFVAAAGAGAAEVIGLRIRLDRGIAGWVVASGNTVSIADAQSDARFDRDTAQRTGYLPTGILATPVDGDDGPVGVLEVLDHVADPRDLQVAADAARQVALVLEIAAAAEQVDDVLADPGLAELVALVHRLRDVDSAHRDLAARLLTAVLEYPR
jgi:signal transduction protein with GAF and PtsI domain